MLDIRYTRPNGSWNRLTARIDNEVVGHLEWAPDTDRYAPGEITGLCVAPKYRRQGIATALWNAAMDRPGLNAPQHSALRTYPGELWARSVGGYLPRLHDGRYMRHSDHAAAYLNHHEVFGLYSRPVHSVRVAGGLL